MITEFKKARRGVLFGVSSFWTGVDIPGKALQKLIITKLPFPSPGDPLMQAQEEIYAQFKRNFFLERSVPMTAIMLKQGFGRLIRTNADKGMVVILDSRIVKKKYGKMLLGALPSNCPVTYGKRNSKLS
jgi:ATP-dependent DNA helicase DinG